ncbi:polyamine-modulated factor 1 isoform X2 [Bufo gargarizans]|uniref:polyamine-modulated factor 1 isoform X2 n=1 Tax=Bufo gargarizans TaxID=30331 RepID=UPI001CF43964|nr:polyamine-modulated factor 1 isoform X2 [Bufo gargarizans]
MEAEETASSCGVPGPSQPAVKTEAAATSADTSGRLLLFNTMVEKFLEGLIEGGSYQRFARCYRRFYNVQPEITRSIYDQFVSQLHASINAEIQEIKDEGSLEALLESLDKLEREAKTKTDPQWRPSGIPEEDVRSHLVPYLLQQREYMRRLLKEKQQENARLAQSVLSGREKIEEMRREIERRKQAWQYFFSF